MPQSPVPCTRIECRFHLARRGHWEHRLTPTRDCALAVANEGPHSLEEIAELLGMTRERVRQIEEAALEKLEASGQLRRFYDESEWVRLFSSGAKRSKIDHLTVRRRGLDGGSGSGMLAFS
jgi:DNA-binding CsgD family transcriptional regulator